MNIEFATCSRCDALRFLQSARPSCNITDTPTSAGQLLDFVERDIVRIRDPLMYGDGTAIVPGTNWNESYRPGVLEACGFLRGA